VVSALLSTRADRRDPAPVGEDTPIGEAGLAISSLHLLQALVRIEDALDLVLDDRAVAEASLHSVGALVDLVEAALDG
jgi:acyl carrier protein